MRNREVNFWYEVVKWLPKKLIYFCFMHVMAYSTTGKYGSTIVPELSGMDAIKRYASDLGKKPINSNYRKKLLRQFTTLR